MTAVRLLSSSCAAAIALWSLLALLQPRIVMAEARQSLSLRGFQLQLEGEGLERNELFARIDELEGAHHRARGEVRGRLAFRLGQLYLATGLSKHRRLALDFLEEAIELAPADRFAAASVRAALAQRMNYLRDARQRLAELALEFPQSPQPHEMLGRLEFLQARGRMRMSGFERARDAFARAVALDSTAVEAWYGLAVAAVALREPTVGLRAVEAMGRLAPQRTESLLLEAVLALEAGDGDRAHRVFVEALARSDRRLRAVFYDAAGFLETSDLERIAARVVPRPEAHAALLRMGEEARLGEAIDWSKALEDSLVRERALGAYWTDLNSHPTQIYNPQELQYWSRLVQADVLFGDPESAIRGWEKATGRALVRWGRPTSTYYDAGNPGGGGSLLGDLDNAGVRLQPGEFVPTGVSVWAWTYRWPGVHFSLIFTDPSLSSRWSLGDSSARSAALYRKQQPLLFEVPELAPSPWRLTVSRLVFPRGEDHAVLETLIGLRPSEDFFALARRAIDANGESLAFAAPTVEWALYDEQNRRIDYRRERLGEEHRRAWLHAALGWEPGDSMLDPYVLPIGAVVPAGRYRLAVEVWGPQHQGHDAVTLEVSVPSSEPPTLLEMSDLQLASAFAPYRTASGIPTRFAKYGQVVVPVPDLRVPSAANRVGVYFEVRNLATDDSGLTRADVTYEVFASSRELRNLTLASDFERQHLDRIDPLTLTFVEERTGVSREGLVVKGIDLDLGGLGTGDYVLVVTVEDRISGREVSRALSFRKRGS